MKAQHPHAGHPGAGHPGAGHPGGHPGAAPKGKPGAPGYDAEGNRLGKAVQTAEGWHSLHTVYRIDFYLWNQFDDQEKREALDELKAFVVKLEEGHQAGTSSYAFYDVVGHKGDLMFWFLRPSLEEINDVELEFRKLKIASVLENTYSFTSVTELSMYLTSKMEGPEVKQKLYPHVPRNKYMCFYPMSKSRNLEDNWYMLPARERGMLMKSHGELGKTYLSVMSEFTTGACGLDVHEWGITLLGDDDIQFKKIVYDMRFEEASARYGIFGDFYVGTIITDDRLEKIFG